MTKDATLTRFELEVMQILWRLAQASVREVREALPRESRPAYTTVQTIVYRLEQKGAVRRVTKDGKAHVFEAALPPSRAYRRVFDDFLSLFGGSAQPLTSYLIESGRLTLDDLRAMERALASMEGRGPRRKV